MGYRSDVVIRATFKTEAEFKNFLVLLKLREPEVGTGDNMHRVWEEFEQFYKVHPDKLGFSAEFHSVEWYSDYWDVEATNKILSLVDEFNGYYKFVRVGENYDDNEIENSDWDDFPHGSWADDISIERTIRPYYDAETEEKPNDYLVQVGLQHQDNVTDVTESQPSNP